MPDTGEPDRATPQAYAIVDLKVPALHTHTDSKAVEREHATLINRNFVEAGRLG
jgi:hypothetical protein